MPTNRFADPLFVTAAYVARDRLSDVLMPLSQGFGRGPFAAALAAHAGAVMRLAFEQGQLTEEEIRLLVDQILRTGLHGEEPMPDRPA